MMLDEEQTRCSDLISAVIENRFNCGEIVGD
jgi:hypothetical protein